MHAHPKFNGKPGLGKWRFCGQIVKIRYFRKWFRRKYFVWPFGLFVSIFENLAEFTCGNTFRNLNT